MSLVTAVRRILSEPRPVLPASGIPAPATEAELRDGAEAILRAAIASADPEALTARAVTGRLRSLPTEGRVWLAAFGRAALGMARGAHGVLGDRVAGGVVVVPAETRGYVAPSIDVFGGSVPVPDEACLAGASAIRALAREAGESDLLLCLVSGGGSSLLTLPPDGVPLDDVQEVTALLLAAGVPVADLNAVRRHLDALKGGQLVREAAPARVLALVLSDVGGESCENVASGPCDPDPTRFSDAIAILRQHRLWESVPLAARGWLDRGVCGEIPETPKKSDAVFLRATREVLASGRTAAAAACAEAERLGFSAQVLTTTLDGDAAGTGRFLAETVRVLEATRRPGDPPACLITAGRVRAPRTGAARGGPNQEVALQAAVELDGMRSVLVASMASCGTDGDSEAAGAIAGGRTAARARSAGVDPEAAVRRHEAAEALGAIDDLIVSGPTGTDVGDLQIVLLG